MDWSTAGALMFISSIFLYLSVRKSALIGTSSQLNNLAMFLLPSILYFIFALIESEKLALTAYQFVIILIQGIFLSYIGNKLSLESIEMAPNPGYSLILSKSYVLFTSIAAVFLFDSKLYKIDYIAIFLIVFFSALVMIDKKQNKKDHIRALWLPYAIGAFFCWGGLSLTSKYLFDIGVPILTRLAYSMFIVNILIIGEMSIKKVAIKSINFQQGIYLSLVGIFATAFNYYTMLGIDKAPNLGYINALNAASIAGVTLFSALIFKDELNIRKTIGIIGVICGVALLVLK